MDAFFAAIEQQRNPKLRDKPVIIGADPKEGKGRGVVSTCSYAARKYGIHSAMPISRAYTLCPHGIYLLPDMKEYSRISAKVFDILSRFAELVEPVSVDEAFLDITGTELLFGKPAELAKKIKTTIFEETGLTASIGISPNKFVSKIASEIQKPNGLVIVNQAEIIEFLRPLPVSKIWGIGKKTETELKSRNINTIGDIQKLDKNRLTELFGKYGLRFWEFSRGIDNRKVENFHTAKSISKEITFDIDTNDYALIEKSILEICENLAYQLRQGGIYCSTIESKIRLKDFTTFNRSQSINNPTRNPKTIFKIALQLFNDFLREIKEKSNNKLFRLIGIKVSNFSDTTENVQLSLFEDENAKLENKSENLYNALDRINSKYNKTVVKLAALGSSKHSNKNYTKKRNYNGKTIFNGSQ